MENMDIQQTEQNDDKETNNTPENQVNTEDTTETHTENQDEDKDRLVDIENVKPSIKVTIETLTPPAEHIDSPRLKMESPVLETPAESGLTRRKRDEEDGGNELPVEQEATTTEFVEDIPQLPSSACTATTTNLEPSEDAPSLPDTPWETITSEAPDDTPMLPSEPCVAETQILEAPKDAPKLPSEPCVAETQILEAPKDAPKLPSEPCVAETQILEAPKDAPELPSEPCVAETQILEAPKDAPELPSEPCVAETRTLEAPKVPSEPCVAETRTREAPRLPLTPCIAKEEVVEPPKEDSNSTCPRKPESALCFALIMAAHAYLGLFCLGRWFFWGDDGFIMVPLFLMTIGAALDNYRLFRGVLLGVAGLDSSLTTTSYILEFTALPLLWICIAEIFSYQTGWWLVPLPARVLAVAFCVSSFNAFMSEVQGHYLVTSDGGVWRHTLDPFKVPFQLMIQPVMVAVAGLFLSFLSLCIYGDAASFLVQVLAFFGQALATREPRSGQYVTNVLEFIYIVSLLYMYMIQV